MGDTLNYTCQLLDRCETEQPTVLIVVGEAGQGGTVQASPEEVNEVFQSAGGTWWVEPTWLMSTSV